MTNRELDPIAGVRLLHALISLRATHLTEGPSVHEVTSLSPQQYSLMLEYHLKNQHHETRLIMSAVLVSTGSAENIPFHLKSCIHVRADSRKGYIR